MEEKRASCDRMQECVFGRGFRRRIPVFVQREESDCASGLLEGCYFQCIIAVWRILFMARGTMAPWLSLAGVQLIYIN